MKTTVKAHHHQCIIMGCAFVITAVHENVNIAWKALKKAESEMRRIEDLISSWKASSQTAIINNNAGLNWTKVDVELLSLIKRSLRLSELTCGAFDISGTLARYYWKMNKGIGHWLDDHSIKELQELINYKNILIDDSTSSVKLKCQGMKIGFGGIGKGYAAQKARELMFGLGIKSGLINASGDLLFWGSPPNKENWDIKIPNPENRNFNLCLFSLASGSVVTSGSFESYTIIDGKQYSHIINPRTGIPVSHTKNVSVVCPNAEFGDALATALSVLPIGEGMALVNKLQGVECIIIDSKDKPHFSNELKTKLYA